VAEVLESNGSSSQASITAGTLALMAGGVPIKAPVAGIAMGLISDGTNYTVLTDIQGLEDHFGDMDFKVAGTRDGITALQMDIKIDGITPQILEEALAQAKKARFEILDVIEATIPEVRPDLAPTAPKIDTIKIDVDKIKIVIGKGGETIDKIIAETGVKIDIDEDGLVAIFSPDRAAIERTKEIIAGLVREAKVDEVFQAKVVRLEKFGAFVNLFDKTDALVHVSEMAWTRVNRPSSKSYLPIAPAPSEYPLFFQLTGLPSMTAATGSFPTHRDLAPSEKQNALSPVAVHHKSIDFLQ
jgi:polyribonucleotide nucleotidyltransferase